MELVEAVYAATEKFPKEEMFGLTAQMRRAAVSIPSNIAEGRTRGHRKEFRQFLWNAYGSAAELATQLEISKKLPKTKGLDLGRAESLLGEVVRMLNAMLRKLKS